MDAKGLCEVIVCACAERDDLAVGVIQRSDDDDGGAFVFGIGAQHSAEFKAVRFGHHQVENEEVGAGQLGNPHRFRTLVFHYRFKTLHGQHFLVQCGGFHFIVHNHDLRHKINSILYNAA